jgi:hypothetical protein
LYIDITEELSMDTFDSPGSILPIGSVDQGIVSKKVTDKEGQGPRQQPQKKAAPVQIPEEDDEESQKEDHVIDIIV